LFACVARVPSYCLRDTHDIAPTERLGFGLQASGEQEERPQAVARGRRGSQGCGTEPAQLFASPA